MRAVYLNEGNIELRELTELPDEGIKVRVKSAGICGSDLHMLDMKFPMDCIAGHEIAGVLDDGTPVAVEPLIPCDDCDYCKAGDYNLCQLVTTLGIGRNGGMADEVIIPERCIVYLPSTIDVKDACLIEPLAVAVNGIRKAGLSGNERVAVIGGGAVGLCAVIAAEQNCKEVGLSARYTHQIDAGENLGAKSIDGQYDLVVECAGTESALNQAMDLCRSGGKLLILGTYWEDVSFPQLAAMMKEIQVINAYTYGSDGKISDFDTAADLLAKNASIANVMITHRFPLAEVNQAFAVAQDRQAGAIKVVLEP